jgi:hypothetical protein
MLLYLGKMNQRSKVFVDSELIIYTGFRIFFLTIKCKVVLFPDYKEIPNLCWIWSNHVIESDLRRFIQSCILLHFPIIERFLLFDLVLLRYLFLFKETLLCDARSIILVRANIQRNLLLYQILLLGQHFCFLK